MEEVFVTDLEVDFPEFRKANTVHKGMKFGISTVIVIPNLGQRFIHPVLTANILSLDTVKQKKMPVELCGALISFSYLKVSITYAVFVVIRVSFMYLVGMSSTKDSHSRIVILESCQYLTDCRIICLGERQKNTLPRVKSDIRQ